MIPLKDLKDSKHSSTAARWSETNVKDIKVKNVHFTCVKYIVDEIQQSLQGNLVVSLIRIKFNRRESI